MNLPNERKIITDDNLVFYIKSLVAEGGTSKIYLAEQEMGDETVTVLLKEYPSLETDPEAAFIRQNEKNQCDRIRESGFPGALPIRYFRDVKDSDVRVGIISDVRRGITLDEYVGSDEWKSLTDYERSCLCSDIYHVVKNFHRETGLLHGDLSPSNIYLYEIGQENDSCHTGKYAVALLDFGCSVPISEDGCQALSQGTKGFAHPDIYNSGYDAILTPDKEWYSLKACLWYAITGDVPALFGMNGRILKNSHPEISVFSRLFDAEPDADGKAISEEIERVQNYLNMPKPDLDHLYESLHRDFQEHMDSRFSDLNVIQRILPGRCFETGRGMNRYEDVADGKQVNFWKILESTNDHIFLIGDGGSGKTTSLIQILKKRYEPESKETSAPVVFLELCLIPQNADEWVSEDLGGVFLEQFLASYLVGGGPGRFAPKDNHYIKEIHEMLFSEPHDGQPQFVVLLDGLNEVWVSDGKNKRLFYDTLNRYLIKAHNARFVIAGRSDVPELADQGLRKLKIVGLDDNAIRDCLFEAVDGGKLLKSEYENLIDNHDNRMLKEHKLWECLRIPFFLIMYCTLSEKKGIATRGDILKRFFHDKKGLKGKTIKYGENANIGERYKDKLLPAGENADVFLCMILDFIVPEIAGYMIRLGEYYVSSETLKGLVDRQLNRMSGSSFFYKLENFYGYEPGVINVAQNCQHLIVEHIVNSLGIMREDDTGLLFFTHQYFRDYFAACAVMNDVLLANEEARGKTNPWALRETYYSLSIFSDFNFPIYFAELLSEILHEADNVPVYDEKDGIWRMPPVFSEEQGLLSAYLDLYRNIDLSKRNSHEQEMFYTAINNIFCVLRCGRNQNGIPDLSALSLRGLDLSRVPLNGVLLSHFNKDGSQGICADISESINADEAVMKGVISGDEVCFDIDPAKRRIIVGSASGKYLRELDVETGDEIDKISIEHEGLRRAFYAGDKGMVVAVFFKPENDSDKKNRFADILAKKIKTIFRKVFKKKENDTDFIEQCVGRGLHESINRMEQYHFEPVEIGTVPFEESVQKRILKEQSDETIRYGEVYFRICRCSTDWNYSIIGCSIEKDVALLHVDYFPDEGRIWLFLQPKGKNPIKYISFDKNTFVKRFSEQSSFLEGDIDNSMHFLQQDRNLFCVAAVNDNSYVIGSGEQWKKGFANWDYKNNILQAAILPLPPESGCEIFCIAYDGNSHVLMFVGSTPEDSCLYKYHISDERANEKEFFLRAEAFEVHVSQKRRIIPTGIEGRFLVLNSGNLMLFDYESGILWNYEKPVIDCHCRNGIFVIDTLDGINLLDVITGGYTPLVVKKPFAQKNIFGRVYGLADESKQLVLLSDGKQVVEWYSLEEGIVRYISVLEDVGRCFDTLYGEWDQKVIYGISKREIFCWNAMSGNVQWKSSIPVPNGINLLDVVLNWDLSRLNGVLEMKNYGVFPVEYTFKFGEIPLTEKENIEKCEWRNGTYDKVVYSCPVRISQFKDFTANELADGDVETKREDVIQYGLVDPEQYYIYNADTDNELSRAFMRYPLKFMVMRENRLNSAFSQVIIRIAEEVIGCCGNTTYTSFHFENNVWIRMYEKVCGFVAEYTGQMPLQGLFLAGEYVVLGDSDRNNLFYWNSKTGRKEKNRSEVNHHEIKDGFLCTDRGLQKKVNPPKSAGKINVMDADGILPFKPLKERGLCLDKGVMLLISMMLFFGFVCTFLLESHSGLLSGNGLDSYLRGIRLLLVKVIMIYGFETVVIQKLLVMPKCGKLKANSIFLFGMILTFVAILASRISPDYMWVLLQKTYFDLIAFLLLPFYVYVLVRPSWIISGRDMKLYMQFLNMLFMLILGLMFYGEESVSGVVFAVYLIVVLAVYYLADYSKKLKYLRKKILLSTTCLFLYFVYDSMVFHSFKIFWDRICDYINSERRSALISLVREVAFSCSYFGEGRVDMSLIDNGEYFHKFLLNFVIGKYGLIAGILLAVVQLLLVNLMFAGAKDCKCYTDRAICLGCSVLVAIHTYSYLLANIGLQILPPLGSAFSIGRLPGYLSFWGAVVTYMAFYKAHKEVYVK